MKKYKCLWVYQNKLIAKSIMPASPIDFDCSEPVNIFNEKFYIKNIRVKTVPFRLRHFWEPRKVYWIYLDKEIK